MDKNRVKLISSKYKDLRESALKTLISYLSIGTLWFIYSKPIANLFGSVQPPNSSENMIGIIFIFVSAFVIHTTFSKKLDALENLEFLSSEDILEFENYKKTLADSSMREQYNLLQKKVHSLSKYDQLTGILNRYAFAERVDDYIINSIGKNSKFALMYIDIDNFNLINDALGHDCGDALLKKMASALKKTVVSSENIIGRLGGDEFVILLESRSSGEIEIKANEILHEVRKPWHCSPHEIYITASIGIAKYPDDGKNFVTLLKNSDTANFHAKETGKDKFCFYSTSIREHTMKNAHMVNQIRYAIDNNEFLLYYQPQINLSTGEIDGVEALIRWLHPKKGFIPPMDFIPFAEETGYIYNIERWVIQKAFKQRNLWADKYNRDIKMSVNLSGKSIMQPETVEVISEIVKNRPSALEYFSIEVTETAVMANLDNAVDTLEKIKNLGIEIALDDFGTGYSSLTYLNKLPIEVLKIDKSFTDSITSEHEDEVIVESVIKLAHNLGLDIVVEGIESSEQMLYFKNHGCNIGQGYLFSKPLPSSELEDLLFANKRYVLA